MRYIKLSILMTVLIFNAVLLLGLFSLRNLPAAPGGGAGIASRNGDVNGDDRLNVSDAIYLLKFMFSGGPEPVACGQEMDCCEEILQRLDEIASRPVWPPRPQDMVNVAGEGPEGDDGHIAFTVPVDRSFVLMKLAVDSNITQILELADQETTIKWIDGDFDSSLGILFSPGSQVMLKLNVPGCGPICNARYALTGYLIDG